ncbi:MAG: S8 family serine peptidase [Promethearchaeota archaeon]
MFNKKTRASFILLNLLILFIFANSIMQNKFFQYTSENNDPFSIDNDLAFSNTYQNNLIIIFNSSFYNSSAISKFEYYGGTVIEEWNGLFTSFSGFSGIMPNESNRTLYQNDFSDATIENNEILITQMNYASIQTGVLNSTWFSNGYNGDTNCSIAVLDTGINPSHEFFPNGYNPIDFQGDIIGWENQINLDPISDDNGHGTFISSIISGTGPNSYKPIQTVTIKIKQNYSHTELFDEYSPSKNYSVKISSFNASKLNSNIVINSSWNWEVGGIDNFWLELFYNNTLVASSNNVNTDQIYQINYTLPLNKLGIYDLFVKYHKQLQTKPIFLLNASIQFIPEHYITNYTYFTGIANATKLVGYKILNQSGIGQSSNLISALANVLSNRVKYHIVSVCLSVGTLGEDVDAINRAIDEVIDKGILVVIAAGNYGIEISDSLNKLATNKNTIVVGATNDKDQVTSYSSMGKSINSTLKPDIVAPGGSKLGGYRTIIAAGSDSEGVTSNYGTSIATAIVSAAINLIIDAKWGNWNQWNNLDVSEWVKIIKATLLMTASETNLEREDDPLTSEDESIYSPPISFAPLIAGIKDVHEGYGRINILSAIDALTKSLEINSVVNSTLVSSLDNPLGPHVYARRIELIEDNQYLFDLTTEDTSVDFDMFLFSNESNQYGEPILIESSQKWYGDFNSFYFTPKRNQTSGIIIVKALEGSSLFSLNISDAENLYEPILKVPEINYFGGSKNTTIMGLQEFFGNNPQKNYSIDSYRFYIEYFDNDTENVPPQEVYVSIKETSKNYTLTQFFPTDNNYTDGALFVSEYIQFSKPGLYQYKFVASDGKFLAKYPTTGFINITIAFPTDSVQFPYQHNFNDGMGNWSYTGTGWDLLNQSNTLDNRSRVHQNSWSSIYFGTYHNFPENYTYQPPRILEDHYPNGTLTSPLYNLTQLNPNNTYPIARFGLRVSINSGDFITLQVNLNWTGWDTIRIYTDQELDWFIEEINMTDYIGNFVQFRFETSLDDTFDPFNYKGLMLDYFSIENYTNNHSPLIKFDLNRYLPIIQESKFYRYLFSCDYYDLDNNYPDFVYLEIDNTNYTMYNSYGDWNASSNTIEDYGILFAVSLLLDEITNQTFRFHISDGRFLNTTQWYNENNTFFDFVDPSPLQFNLYQDTKYIGYHFSNTNLTDYYITGYPTPKQSTEWLGGDNTWHPYVRLGQNMIYGGVGQSFGGNSQGYGVNWDANLITRPLRLEDEYSIYLEFDYDISLQNEFFQPEDQRDKCLISISDDYGETWNILKEFSFESDDLSGNLRIDISEYSNNEVMIMFTLNSNGITLGIGYGWLLYNIYIGYDKTTDFIAPEVEILNPTNDTTIRSATFIEVNLSDNVAVDESRLYIFLNGKSVDRTKLDFNSSTNILKFKWNTKVYNDGYYEVRIVVYDKAGNIGESQVIVRVNNMKWWSTWWPYIILISFAVILCISIYVYLEKKGKMRLRRLRELRAEKIRLSGLDKDQIIKKIELVDPLEVEGRPLTLYCKYCRSWFSASNFDIMCPSCGHDQIYVAYNCTNCGNWSFKDEPKETYFCKNKACQGVRLIRREKEEVENILAQKGRVLKKFEIKKKKYSILDKS